MTAGAILWMDWRGDAFRKEANKLRPGIVVETSDLFGQLFRNVLVVPCTTSLTTEVSSLCVENKTRRNEWIRSTQLGDSARRHRRLKAAHHSKDVLFIAPQQLWEIRSRIAEVLDIA